MVKRIIKEYELFDGGSSYLEVYHNINADYPWSKFHEEMADTEEIESILESKGVTSFRLMFKDKGLEKISNDKESIIYDLNKIGVSY